MPEVLDQSTVEPVGETQPLPDIGDLVLYQREGEEERVGRVAWVDTDPNLCCPQVWVAGSIRIAAEGIIRILPQDTMAETKEPRLQERRETLQGQIDRLRDAGRVESDLLSPLADALYRRTWFWQYVACSLDCPRQISYAARPEDVENDARRKHCSLHKFLSGPAKKYGGLDCYTREQIDAISALFGEKVPATWDQDVQVLRGSGIVKAYAVGPQSCMQGRTYVRWYEENPEHCALLVVMEDERCIARSVAWTTDCGATSLCTIYSDNNRATKAIEDKARALGWGVQSSFPRDATVTMRPSCNGTYPYLDAFRYSNDNPRTASKIVLGKGSNVCFSSQHGGWVGEGEDESEAVHYASCNCCHCDLYEDETNFSEGGDGPYCDSCYSDRYTYLSYRLPDGARVEEEVSREDARECDCCAELRRIEDFEEDSIGTYFCLLCMADHTICVECGEFVSCSDSVEVEGGDFCVPCGAAALAILEQRRLDEDTADVNDKKGEDTSCECGKLCPAGVMPGQLLLGSLECIRQAIAGYDTNPLILWIPLV